jgi:hypothetical protein
MHAFFSSITYLSVSLLTAIAKFDKPGGGGSGTAHHHHHHSHHSRPQCKPAKSSFGSGGDAKRDQCSVRPSFVVGGGGGSSATAQHCCSNRQSRQQCNAESSFSADEAESDQSKAEAGFSGGGDAKRD